MPFLFKMFAHYEKHTGQTIFHPKVRVYMRWFKYLKTNNNSTIKIDIVVDVHCNGNSPLLYVLY